MARAVPAPFNPERTDLRLAQLRKRARRALERAGVKVGGDHLIEPIVEAMIVECEGVRERCGRILDTLIERGDRLVLDSQPMREGALEDLREVVVNHHVDRDGQIQMRGPDGAA